jgi:alpha-L-fucosidase 2
LLPALPKAWPTGSVRGLRARGGFGVDIAWIDGRLESATISGKPGTKSVARYGGTEILLDMGSRGSCRVVLEGGALRAC